jgi:hypothetical protein
VQEISGVRLPFISRNYIVVTRAAKPPIRLSRNGTGRKRRTPNHSARDNALPALGIETESESAADAEADAPLQSHNDARHITGDVDVGIGHAVIDLHALFFVA